VTEQQGTALLTTEELHRVQQQVACYGAVSLHPAVSRHGQWHSAFRGQGMDLMDSRAYQAGDDIRYIDWRATARSGRVSTKVFREERQSMLTWFVDRSPTMAFASCGELKAARAVRVAAALTFSALATGDRVAGLTAGHREQFFPATATLDGALHMLRAIAAPLPHGSLVTATAGCDWGAALGHLCRAVRLNTTVCLISDFRQLQQQHLPWLQQLSERRQVRAFVIKDPAEGLLPDVDRVRLCLPGSGAVHTIDCSNVSLRMQYAAAVATRSDQLRQWFAKSAIVSVSVRTDSELFAQLSPP